MLNVKSIGMVLGLSTALLLGGCGSNEGTENEANASVSEQVNYTVTGIEPGAGITNMAHQTLEE